MTKPSRSPILGYNHNIQFHGHVFHVQTEDSGTGHARLFTHLFFEGTILASKKQEYDAGTAEDAVRLLMQQMHKAMIKELKEGVHDPRIVAFFTARGEPIVLGDRPSLLSMPVVAEAPAVTEVPSHGASQAYASAQATHHGTDDRPVAISGSIDTSSNPKRVDVPAARPASVVHTPTPSPVRRPVVVVKPPELKRPPVVVTSSAEGVVVKRNVVINVGGGTGPVQGQISRGAAIPRPSIPYVVREGSYPLPTVSRGSGPHQAQQNTTPPADGQPAAPSARDVRMPWDAGAPTPGAAAMRGRPTGVSEHTPSGRAIPGSDGVLRTRSPVPPSERTPAERAFAADLTSDKSLDEVILEYLSDDAE